MRVMVASIVMLILTGCGAGYHRVRYTEMPNPPTVTLTGNKFIVTTRNTNGDGLSVYKVDIQLHDRARTIELKGYQAVGKQEKTEFAITLSEAQLAEIRNYRMYWIDPGGRKTKLAVSDKL